MGTKKNKAIKDVVKLATKSIPILQINGHKTGPASIILLLYRGIKLESRFIRPDPELNIDVLDHKAVQRIYIMLCPISII